MYPPELSSVCSSAGVTLGDIARRLHAGMDEIIVPGRLPVRRRIRHPFTWGARVHDRATTRKVSTLRSSQAPSKYFSTESVLCSSHSTRLGRTNVVPRAIGKTSLLRNPIRPLKAESYSVFGATASLLGSRKLGWCCP